MKLKNNNILHFGLDYLEVKGTSKTIESINFGIGNIDCYIQSDIFPGFFIKKVNKVMNYEYKIVLKKDGYDCFAYHKGCINGGVETKDFISVYGIAFKIFKDVNEIMEFLYDNIIFSGIRRFDLALDINIDLEKIHKKFNKKIGKGSIFLNNIGKVQTFYNGEKKKSENKYKLLRCYNKKDDIIRTNRQKIYPEYLQKEYVSRIELEFRSELCKNLTLEKLSNKKHIFNIFLTYIKQYTDIFSKFGYEIEKLNVMNKRIDIDSLRYDEIINEKYIRIFLGYAQKINEIGACATDILIRNNVINESTKKDIVLSIKNGIFRQDIYEFGLNIRNSKYIFSKELDDVIYLDNKDNND